MYVLDGSIRVPGGHGGGAIQLTANESLVLGATAAIRANGVGGRSAESSDMSSPRAADAGGGGGGLVVLEAQRVEVYGSVPPSVRVVAVRTTPSSIQMTSPRTFLLESTVPD
ncbi:MAG: hypothetical protein R3A78_06115 [Polyangiales bacterium]